MLRGYRYVLLAFPACLEYSFWDIRYFRLQRI